MCFLMSPSNFCIISSYSIGGSNANVCSDTVDPILCDSSRLESSVFDSLKVCTACFEFITLLHERGACGGSKYESAL